MPFTSRHPSPTQLLWLAYLACAMAIALLLLTFVLVARGAVRQGEFQKLTHALQLQWNGRCNAMAAQQRRSDCLALVQGLAPGESLFID